MTGKHFSVSALPQNAKALDLFPGWGILQSWHAFYVCRGIQSQAGDGGLTEMTIGQSKKHLCEDTELYGDSLPMQQGWSPNLLFLPQHPCTFPSPHPLLPQLPSLYSSSLSSFAWILSIADFSSAIKLNIPQRGGKQEF